MSKVGASEKPLGDPYMMSQTYFIGDISVHESNRQLLGIQSEQKQRLAQPKRPREKFSSTQTKAGKQPKTKNFIEKLKAMN